MRRTKRIFTIMSLLVAVYVVPSRGDCKGDSKAVKVSGGEDHTLLVTADKGAWSCGPNGGIHVGVGDYWGVLGTGSTQRDFYQPSLGRVYDGTMATDSNRLENITDIDAGWKHSLALDVNGFVWSWGWNSQGQLGDGFQNERTTPVKVKSGEQDPESSTTYLRYICCISAGRSGEHSLAVDANGYVYAWGRNAEGQLGYGVTGSYKTMPVEVNDVSDTGRLEGIIEVSAGEWHSMGLEDYDPCDPNWGRVYTWGDDDFAVVSGGGVLGIGDGAGDRDTPVCVLRGMQDYNEPGEDYLRHIVAISAGWDHCMALEKYEPYDDYQHYLDPNGYIWPDPNHRGRVYTWGNNGQGWGDDGDTNKSNGGRLGNGSTTDGNSTPVLVLRGEQPPDEPNDTYPYLCHIVAVSAGEAHSMALDVNGYVYTWGDNQHGQLGDGTTDQNLAPIRVVGEDGVGDLENIVAIAAGYWHSLAIDANGTIWTWGKGSGGRLGLGNEIDCHTPHRIPMVYNLTQETLYFTIQSAIDDANDAGDTLEAWPGTYYENVNFLTKTIILRSADPNNADVVEDTIIQGSGGWDIPAVQFTANPNSTLTGFTIANDDYGIKCDSSSPTISDSVIANCGRHGLYCLNNSVVEVKNCTISGNGADYSQDGVNCSGSEMMLSHCLITANAIYGIYCNQSTATMTNCAVEENEYMGVYAQQTTLGITNSIFRNNGDYGIKAYDNCDLAIGQSLIKGNGKSGVYALTGCDFVLDRSIVCDNGWDGVDLEYNNPETLTNNWIYNNGRTHPTYQDGVWFMNSQASAPLVRNNTICGNPTYGIKVFSQQTDPTISNCIIYGNEDGDLSGTFSDVNYCCLQNERGTDNITSDPCFVDPDPNDFHLAACSPCIDAGDPGFEAEPNETDIDGNPRVIGDQVDIGADEFWATDFSRDGLVNFVDYAMLAAVWQTEPNDANYNDDFDLEDDDSIDFGDVLVLCEDWLLNAELWPGPTPLTAGRSAEGMVEGLRLQAAPYELAAFEPECVITEPVDVKELLDWLAEIWLDIEVRKEINENDWLRLYQSLNEL